MLMGTEERTEVVPGSGVVEGSTCVWPRRLGPAEWIALGTEAQGELRAYRWLTYSGVQCFVPIEQRSVAQNFNRRRTVRRPIFPGYVFAKLRATESIWDRVESAPVSIRKIKIEGHPIIMPEALIEQLRAIEWRLNNPAPPPPPIPLKIGEKVEVLQDDLWAGHFAMIERIDERGRIGLLMEVFRRLVRIEVSANQVRLAESCGIDSAARAKR